MFSGSYAEEDVTFLLKVIDMPPMDVLQKERLIQSSQRHYSEIISEEEPPAPEYLSLYQTACERNNSRFAEHLAALACHIADSIDGDITLVSLARAGTPVGVLLRRMLLHKLRRQSTHYSVSIIRDRGIDTVALRHILSRGHRPESIVFLDGWTGKGVIARELASAIGDFNEKNGTSLPSGVHVVADLCGAARVAPTSEDYLIPCSILNSVVSGLVSRSILNANYVHEGDFHGCLFYEHFHPLDLSREFASAVMAEAEQLPDRVWSANSRMLSPAEKLLLRRDSETFMASLMGEFGIKSANHVKPGIGESTRVLLRRTPYRLLVRNAASPEVQHLVHLAETKGIPWVERTTLPFAATAMIKEF